MTSSTPCRFAEDAESVLAMARLHALTRGEPKVTTEGLFIALVLERRTPSARILAALGVTPGQARAWLDHQVGWPVRRVAFDYDAPYTQRMRATITAAAAEAAVWGTTRISTVHLLIGILREPHADRGAVAVFLRGRGFTVERLRAVWRDIVGRSASWGGGGR